MLQKDLSFHAGQKKRGQRIVSSLFTLKEPIQPRNLFCQFRSNGLCFYHCIDIVGGRREGHFHHEDSNTLSSGIKQWKFEIVECTVVFLAAVGLAILNSVQISAGRLEAYPAAVGVRNNKAVSLSWGYCMKTHFAQLRMRRQHGKHEALGACVLTG